MTRINLLVLVAIQLFIGALAESLGFLKVHNATPSFGLPSKNATGPSLLQEAEDASSSNAEQSEGTHAGDSNDESVVQAGSDMALYGNAGGEAGSDMALYGGAQSMLEIVSKKAHSLDTNSTMLENSSANGDAVTAADLASADDDETDDAIDNDETDDEDDTDVEDIDEINNAKEVKVADDTSDGVDETDMDEETSNKGAGDTNLGDESSLLQDAEDTEDDSVESDVDQENTIEQSSDDGSESSLKLQGQDDDDDQSVTSKEEIEEQDDEIVENPLGAALIQEQWEAQKTTEDPGDLADAELEKIQLAEDLETDSSQEDEPEEVKLEEDAWTERGAMYGMTD